MIIKNVYKKVFLGGGGSRNCVSDERAIERALWQISLLKQLSWFHVILYLLTGKLQQQGKSRPQKKKNKN